MSDDLISAEDAKDTLHHLARYNAGVASFSLSASAFERAMETIVAQAAEIADLRRQLAEAQGLIYSARQERDAAEDAEKELAEELRTAKRQLAEVREVLLSLPAVYARQINTGVREVYDPLQRLYRMEDVLHALNPKGTADDRA